ncbi:aldo/keto reductase [Microlunatus soli]|uniref:D-threo-aldose 1-dehydrogenase n=1 Tax=Microlunatus soli TaxID=630515 RepID=A0A1H1NKF5_9ACTN|nr:aldo/keto reductase [Microlunatus soli]SDR99175.1 D-threo-aldose 1-dehydrogenase [Microlunatus soli]
MLNESPALGWAPQPWLRPLGATGLTVSAVTLGGGPLGSMPQLLGYQVAAGDAIELVRQVLDSPIRTIDTANGYSDGESERRIGAAVRATGGLPDDFMIITKVDAKDGDYSGDRVRRSVAESKQRLGLDRLPLVMLHDPEFFDFDEMAAPGGAVETLQRLREEDEIDHVGLAGGDTAVMRRYLDLGGFEVLLVHNRWTLVDHSAAELIDAARAAGIAVINAAIYGGGLLAAPHAGGTRYGYREATAATLSAVAEMAAACERYGTDLATAALHASIRDPRISTTITGFSKPERLRALRAGLEHALPDGLFTELAALLPDRANWLDS